MAKRRAIEVLDDPFDRRLSGDLATLLQNPDGTLNHAALPLHPEKEYLNPSVSEHLHPGDFGPSRIDLALRQGFAFTPHSKFPPNWRNFNIVSRQLADGTVEDHPEFQRLEIIQLDVDEKDVAME